MIMKRVKKILKKTYILNSNKIAIDISLLSGSHTFKAHGLISEASDLATLTGILLSHIGNFLEFLLLRIVVKFPVSTYGGFA